MGNIFNIFKILWIIQIGASSGNDCFNQLSFNCDDHNKQNFNKWKWKIGSMSSSRSFVSCIMMNDYKLFCCGRYDTINNNCLNIAEYYMILKHKNG